MKMKTALSLLFPALLLTFSASAADSIRCGETRLIAREGFDTAVFTGGCHALESSSPDSIETMRSRASSDAESRARARLQKFGEDCARSTRGGAVDVRVDVRETSIYDETLNPFGACTAKAVVAVIQQCKCP